jgi:phage shock protein A
MKLHEFATPLKTFIARVRLKNGSIAIATERTESLSYARMLLHHKFGNSNVFSVTEIRDSVIDEATQTLSTQQLQVKSLSDQEAKIKQQKKQLVAKQAMSKAQEKMRQAQSPLVTSI